MRNIFCLQGYRTENKGSGGETFAVAFAKYLILFDKLLNQGDLSFAYFTELFNYDQFAEGVADAFLIAVLMVEPGLCFIV